MIKVGDRVKVLSVGDDPETLSKIGDKGVVTRTIDPDDDYETSIICVRVSSWEDIFYPRQLEVINYESQYTDAAQLAAWRQERE